MHQHLPNPISCKAVFLFSIVDNIAPYISVSRTLDSIPKWKPTRWPDYPHTKMLCQLANAMKSPSEILAQYLAVLTAFFSYTKSYFQSFFISRTDLVLTSSYQKHLGLFLDSKLDFDEHIKVVFEKTSKSTGLIRKLRNFLPRPSLLQIYKSFVRPHLDYGDIIYDKAFIGYFQRNLNPFKITQLQP